MSTSVTGGYTLPTSTVQPPRHLSLEQFLQTVLVGVSGLPGPLVRPRFQIEPPKQPDIAENWLAFSVMEERPDANGALLTDGDGATTYQRHSDLSIQCSFYGPRALDYAELVRDGFQIPQNRDALTLADMGFVETTSALRMPELINERWFNRFEMGIRLRREIKRTYAILPILSANGTISAVAGNEDWLINWQTQEA